MANPTLQYPRPGMLATIRNRRGIISSVDVFSSDSTEGQLHLVRIEYTDSDGVPEDTVLWEREHGRDLLEPNALPRVEAEPAMEPREFDAIVRAARWSALTPFLHPDGSNRSPETPVSAPFFGAVQVDDFQLVPLLKALQMPPVGEAIACRTTSDLLPRIPATHYCAATFLADTSCSLPGVWLAVAILDWGWHQSASTTGPVALLEPPHPGCRTSIHKTLCTASPRGLLLCPI